MKSLSAAVALLIGVSAMAQTPVLQVQADKEGQLRQVLENFGQSALTLEQNRGQAPQGVDFVALGLGHKFLLSPSGATLEFDAATKSSHSVQLQLVGGNPSSPAQGLDRVAFTSAYFSANDPKGLLRNLPNYAKVRYREVWPGIDVVYYGNRDKLEYDMLVAPQADPQSIRIKLTGESRFALNSAGDLELQTPYGTVIHHRPLAFQVIDHERKEVPAGYALVADNEVRIQLGKYDRSHELVIDPTLALSSPTIKSPVTTVLADVDGAGNIYAAVASGQGSLFILAFGANGVVINQGTIFGADTTAGMVVTSAGKVYLTGSASGTSFPANGYQTQLAGPSDAYFLEYVGLPTQSVVYGTFFGGAGNDSGTAIAVDGAGNAYITGQTVGGTGFVHTTGPAFGGGGTDAFVAKFNPAAAPASSLVFSTFIGGNGADSGNGIGVDSNGNSVYVGGATTSTSASFQPSSATGFNTSKTTATNDGFTVKLNSTGASASYLTFLPSAPVNALAVDSSFAAYVTGAVDGTTNVLATTASGFQVTNGGNGCASIAAGSPCTDAFLSKYNTTVGGNGSLLYSSYLGGNLSDSGTGIAVDNSGNAYVAGRTNSSNFPTARPLANLATYQGGAIVDSNTLSTQFDAFVAKINTNDSGLPSLVYSTYLGGADTDQANNIAIDASGNAFIGGTSSSTNFPNTTASVSATGAHAFFSKITDTSAGVTLSITKTHSGTFAQGQQNATYTVTVSNVGSAATSGAVTVTETLPAGLVLVSMAGSGWSCAAATCTRSDALGAGGAYPAITVTVNVTANATSPQVNQVSVSGGGSPPANASDSTTIPGALGTPAMTVNRTRLNFGYGSGLITSPQTVTVSITGGAGVGWTASSNAPNVTVSPASGTGSGTFQVTATPPSGGSGAAIVTVSAPGATGSPQQIQVNVTGITSVTPFGSFDTPTNNTTGIAGSIAVTGWALDSIEITSVGIWREPIPGEATAPNGLVFIGNANFVADARPDVAAAFASSPYQYRAGWGYLMLTNFLPNSVGPGRGNGTYNLHAIMTNKAGTVVDLGVRTITVDNAHGTKPFGAIDTPDQGGTASGNAFVNFGWALTQNPYVIPTDGSTITVFLDGAPAGHPTYNQFRNDIATLFPGYANSNGAVGFFFIDTTKLQNGVHTISWSVTDNGNRTDGIGSRYFTAFNAGGIAAPEEPPTPESLAGPVQLRVGYDLNASAVALAPDSAGSYSIEMEQLGRIELSLGASKGYLVVGDQAQELPLGSSLTAGVFYWQAPLGFLGKYELMFERPDGTQVRVHVNIAPKQYALQ